MIEELIEQDDLFSDAPYLQHIRDRCAQAREEGILFTRRLYILDALQVRFNPPDTLVQAFAQMLAGMTDEAELQRLFHAVLQAESLTALQATLAMPRPAASEPPGPTTSDNA